jgi:hypothetical protein
MQVKCGQRHLQAWCVWVFSLAEAGFTWVFLFVPPKHQIETPAPPWRVGGQGSGY